MRSARGAFLRDLPVVRSRAVPPAAGKSRPEPSSPRPGILEAYRESRTVRPMPMLSLAATPLLALVLGAGAPAPSPNAGEAARVMAFDRFAAGRDALTAKRWADAETEFGDALRLQPGLALAHYGLGQALMGQARYAEAADAFLSCRNVFAPGPPDGRDEGARDGDPRPARHAAGARRTATRSPPTASWRCSSRSAWPSCRKARRGPRPGSARRHPGPRHRVLPGGGAAEAEQELLAVLRQDPSSGDAENNLAVLYLAMGRLDEAEAAARGPRSPA